MLDFKFQRAFGKEVSALNLAETLKRSGFDATAIDKKVSIKGLKSFFCNGEATVNTDGNMLKAEGKVMPSVPAMILTGISVVLVIIFLFTEMEYLDDLLGVMVSGIIGVSGLFSCLTAFFGCKNFMVNELAQIVTFSASEK